MNLGSSHKGQVLNTVPCRVMINAERQIETLREGQRQTEWESEKEEGRKEIGKKMKREEREKGWERQLARYPGSYCFFCLWVVISLILCLWFRVPQVRSITALVVATEQHSQHSQSCSTGSMTQLERLFLATWVVSMRQLDGKVKTVVQMK